MTGLQPPPEQRLDGFERQLELLRSGVVPDLRQGVDEPPVGVIADFVPAGWPLDLVARAARDPLPIPDAATREGYCPGHHAAYWLTGLEDYDKVVAAAHDVSVSGSRVYDFGGSTGRVFRHFYCQDRRFEVWTSDFKVQSYLWNQRHMPQDVRVFLNSFSHSLPVPDQYFDIVTAFSVFTHIDELESPWLLELRRILKPGGLLYVTIHDEACWGNMAPFLLGVLQRSTNGQGLTADSPFPGQRAVFHFTSEGYYNCNVFHSREYIRQQWGRYFDVLDMRPLQAGQQCVVLLSYRE
jgi:SAM-dependent methyltransferase